MRIEMRNVVLWQVVGFFGQALFFTRFLVQWIASERNKKSVVPVSFWLFSLGGSLVLLAYSIHRQDPVFIAGQSLGFVIYSRNLVLLRNARTKTAA
jgi:lipid-A-disaccharide synthase-like uncharacterized protein